MRAPFFLAVAAARCQVLIPGLSSVLLQVLHDVLIQQSVGVDGPHEVQVVESRERNPVVLYNVWQLVGQPGYILRNTCYGVIKWHGSKTYGVIYCTEKGARGIITCREMEGTVPFGLDSFLFSYYFRASIPVCIF